jgi:hypothetical protein
MMRGPMMGGPDQMGPGMHGMMNKEMKMEHKDQGKDQGEEKESGK